MFNKGLQDRISCLLNWEAFIFMKRNYRESPDCCSQCKILFLARSTLRLKITRVFVMFYTITKYRGYK